MIPTRSDKEPGVAPSATENENADGEKVIVPGTPEMVLEDKVNSEIKTSKPGQLRSAYPPTFQCFLFPEDEKMETIQDGREFSLKDKQKTMTQDHSQIMGQKEEEGGFGECC
ncbi:hypothetical protein U0070_005245 [Myodes glareolus]|uniref:Uncharacterized protein n=1 Tax=Myodes glareolus TaxID=447135 RepID=A0AAW0H714_MYOGA